MTLNKYQQRVFDEFVALHKLTHAALDDRNCPPEVVALLSEFLQGKIKKLQKKDFEAVARSFIDLPS